MAEHFLDFFFENILLISIAFISGSLLVWPLLTKNIGIKRLSTADATTMLNRQNGILIDLREDDDMTGGVIPQAERIPSSILLKRREEFDKHKKKFQDRKNKNKPIIYDIIYNPAKTRLIKIAKSLNLKCLNGLNMNLYQAALAFNYVNRSNLKLDKIKKIMKG